MVLPKGFLAPVALGEGGQAHTFLCWQQDPGRWVVLKVAKASGAAGLRREASLLGRLAGGPVPALLGQNLAARQPWLAMSWIEGMPLDALPETLVLSDRRAIVLQATLAAARLHGACMVHGDLSAANLIARPHGEVGVVDFGLSPMPGSDEIPALSGAWEILPPERLQGARPDPRWDVFALGVIGSRLLGGAAFFGGSRDEWTAFVNSGEAAKSARGRSWGLSLALDPDPLVRPADAAALVRLLEKEWGDPAFSRDRFAAESAKRLDVLLAVAVAHADTRRDWDSAWRLQRERIERTVDPEPLLAKLGGFQRKRRHPSGRARWWALAAAAVAVVAAIAVWKVYFVPEDNPSVLEPAPTFFEEGYGEPEEVKTSSLGVLVFDPPPPGARLQVDGKPVMVPMDGFLKLKPGTRRVVLLDSLDGEILDTIVVVPKPDPPRRAKNSRTVLPSAAKDSVIRKVKP